ILIFLNPYTSRPGRDVTCREPIRASARSHRTTKGRFALVPYRKNASHWFPTGDV
ncbi:unnamed protein product, partial [Callosobruchus maculatus]